VEAHPNRFDAKNDAYTVVEDSEKTCFDVTSNDKGEFDKFSVEITSIPNKKGSATIDEDFLVCYIPAADFFGTELFTYRICTIEDADKCSEAVVRISVTPVNDAPRLQNDWVQLNGTSEIIIDVLKNDWDVDSVLRIYSLKIFHEPENGDAIITSDAKILYRALDRFIGLDTFKYQICDCDTPSLCSHATVQVQVEERCFACEKCKEYLETYTVQTIKIETVYKRVTQFVEIKP
jgi:hypothetical protein